MKRSLLKFQLVFEAFLLLATIVIVSTVLYRYNYRWDLTQEKVYSLPKATVEALKGLKGKRIDVNAFYLQHDRRRTGLEIFFKECQQKHPEFHYNFYDPTRRPQLAKKFRITEPGTVIIQSGDREEKILGTDEEAFTNAFLRILHPKNISLCFVQGHGEVEINGEEPTGYRVFRDTLTGYNATINEIVLARDHVPDACEVIIVGGPRWEIPDPELEDLKTAFYKGKGILFLLDPMDPGTGQVFIAFAKDFATALGNNVVVDKASRIVGGDFLMPLVSRYFMQHPISKVMKQATFFPLVRSVQPSSDLSPSLEVTPLAMTSPDSWAETDLAALENGDASFDVKTDIAGPLPVAVAIEQKTDGGEGRMAIVGDSDFLNNSYLGLSGNKEFGLNIIRWLAKDDRFIEVHKPHFKFKSLILDASKRSFLIFSTIVIFPAVFFILGGIYLVIRSRTS